MTREEVIQIAEEVVQNSATRSIIMFLELNDNDLFPKPLPHAQIITNNVWFDEDPELNDGTKLEQDPDYSYPVKDAWRMARHKEDLLDGFTWFSIGTFRGNGSQVGAWTTPILAKIGRDGAPGLNGRPGGDGADGTSIEYIFRLAENEQQFNNFATPYSDSSTTNYIPTVDNGGVPEGDEQYGDWYDHPEGVSEDYKIEAMCFRKRNIEANQWSEFYGPYKWSIWGNEGRDGDGVEYIFKLATLDGENSEAEYDVETNTYRLKRQYWPPTDQASYDALTPEEKEAYNRTDIEYYPEGWIDDPQDVNDEYPVQFVSIRKYNGTNSKWGFFSEPTCWNKIPLTDSIVTAFTAIAFCITTKDISGYKPTHEHSSSMDPDPDDFDYQGEHITWSDSIPSSGTGYVWMTTSVWRDGEITEEGWSYPMKINDSPGFQAEYSNDYPWDRLPSRPKLPNFGEGAWAEDEVAWRAKALELGCGTWSDCKSDDSEDYITDPTFMATCQKKDGTWTDWVIAKIKGENGLSTTVLHIWNDSIGVTVDGDNRTWSATSHTVTVEVQMGSENFEIDPANVSFSNQNGGSIPQGITFTNIRVNETHYRCSFEINIAQGITFNDTLPIRINIVGDGYDANSVIEIRPIPSADGCVYEIVANEYDIYRTYTSNGSCSYSPSTLTCTGTRTVGMNAPETYGTLYYSTSLQRDDAKFNIGDTFDQTVAGVVRYPNNGIMIGNLTNHANLQIIYVYMVREDGKVADVEGFEIDTKGHYELTTSTNQVHINGATLIPSTVNVFVWYMVPEKNTKGLVNNHLLCYYINGDSSNIGVSNIRNGNSITLTSLTGFNIETTKSVDFVLRDSNGNDLTDSVTISFIIDGTNGHNGEDGTSISGMYNFYKAAGETPAQQAPDESHSREQIVNLDGWSTAPVDLSEQTPVLWQFIRIEYSDNSVEHLTPFPVRYYNQQAVITYDQVEGFIEQKLTEEFETAETRLHNIDQTDVLINTNKGTGLIQLLTQYKNGSETSFADVIANAATAEIKLQVASDVNELLTTAGTTLNGLKGSVDTHAAKLDGITGTVQGAISSVATDAITQAVTKAQYCWIGLQTATIIIDETPDDPEIDEETGEIIRIEVSYNIVKGNQYPYGLYEGNIPTKRMAGEDFAEYETRIQAIVYNENPVFQKKLISEEMSTIKVESDKISLLTGNDGNFKAGIQIIAEVPTNEDPIPDPAHPGQYLPAGSAIILDASNVIINGGLSASAIQAQSATITSIVAGSVKANSLETGNIESQSGMGTLIEDGKLDVYYNGVKRANFGMEDGDIVLKFYDSSGQEQYNLGPSGFRDKYKNVIYEDSE